MNKYIEFQELICKNCNHKWVVIPDRVHLMEKCFKCKAMREAICCDSCGVVISEHWSSTDCIKNTKKQEPNDL